MIYLDNAATTMLKPQPVIDAVSHAMTSFGGVGRGVHPASIAAGMAVFGHKSDTNPRGFCTTFDERPAEKF